MDKQISGCEVLDTTLDGVEGDQVSELNELHLALVGGGCGEVVFH